MEWNILTVILPKTVVEMEAVLQDIAEPEFVRQERTSC